MKLALTITDDFPFPLSVCRVEGGWSASWKAGERQSEVSLQITEQMIRDRCSERELGDCANVYLETSAETGRWPIYVHNKMATTSLTKNGGYRHLMKNQRICLGQVYIPFLDSPVEDWLVRLNGCSVEGSVPEQALRVENSEKAFTDLPLTVWPGMRIKSVSSLDADRTEVLVQLTQGGSDLKREGVRVFASTSAGYISKQESYTSSEGVARLIARRLDLEPEDRMVVEFGFKFRKNIAHADIPCG